MKEKVIKLIYDSIDEVNKMNELTITKNVDTVLFGRDSDLDSLGLVNLIVSIEGLVNESFDTSISIADEKAMSQKNSPFRTVETLANYVELLIKEEQNG
ncbi:MAG: hypothetical protein WCY79_00860 [Bacteroidales bacterium]